MFFVFLDFQLDDAQVFNFSSFFFFLQSHFGFTCFFSSNFIFCCPSFFLTFFYHNSSLLRIYLLFLGTWGDFLRWFRYLDFFFIPKRDNHDVFVLFSYDFESAEEEKKKDWIDFFWLGEQKKFFEWFFSRNRWSKWPYDFHKCDFFLFRYRFTEFVRFWFDFLYNNGFFFSFNNIGDEIVAQTSQGSSQRIVCFLSTGCIAID